MKLVSENTCNNNIGELKGILEVVLNGVEKGDFLLIHRRDDDYHVMLIGDRGGE